MLSRLRQWMTWKTSTRTSTKTRTRTSSTKTTSTVKTVSTDPYQDQTPCIDAFGDRSTVGFELLWRDLWREIRKPPLPYYKTHDINPFNLVCLRCGRSERDIHWEKLRCESSPSPSSPSGS